ncbi:hypothetical protein ACRBEV_24860 [Methylobacterium phyllosphaerae]
MRSGSRLSERWFTLALWLVALVFAWFLIGLGALVVVGTFRRSSSAIPSTNSSIPTRDGPRQRP